jgi:hypothetical protein
VAKTDSRKEAAMSSGETEPHLDVRSRLASLLEKLPSSAREKSRVVVDAWLEDRKKLKKDFRALVRFFDAIEESDKGNGPGDSAWRRLVRGLEEVIGGETGGEASRLSGKIRDLLLEDTIATSSRFYRDDGGILMEHWKDVADGGGPGRSLEERIAALKILSGAHEILGVTKQGLPDAPSVPGESMAEECETIYRLYVDCAALFTVIKGHLEGGRKMNRVEWRFTHGGDAQNPAITQFLEESGLTEEDIRLRTQKVIDSFVSWKKILSVRVVRERYREGRRRHVERIKGELRDNYGQYMDAREIEEKAVADEEERRNVAIERRIRAMLHASR